MDDLDDLLKLALRNLPPRGRPEPDQATSNRWAISVLIRAVLALRAAVTRPQIIEHLATEQASRPLQVGDSVVLRREIMSIVRIEGDRVWCSSPNGGGADVARSSLEHAHATTEALDAAYMAGAREAVKAGAWSDEEIERRHKLLGIPLIAQASRPEETNLHAELEVVAERLRDILGHDPDSKATVDQLLDEVALAIKVDVRMELATARERLANLAGLPTDTKATLHAMLDQLNARSWLADTIPGKRQAIDATTASIEAGNTERHRMRDEIGTLRASIAGLINERDRARGECRSYHAEVTRLAGERDDAQLDAREQRESLLLARVERDELRARVADFEIETALAAQTRLGVVACSPGQQLAELSSECYRLRARMEKLQAARALAQRQKLLDDGVAARLRADRLLGAVMPFLPNGCKFDDDSVVAAIDDYRAKHEALVAAVRKLGGAA